MPSENRLETAVFGGGCFWCIEPIFAALRGVHEVVPGYAGGHVDNPSYEQVCSQNTGHIEVIRLTFDPLAISYQTLLEVFFAVHDPTTLNRQGADIGPQYASAIFAQSDRQAEQARLEIARTENALGRPVVTRILSGHAFWPAESYHHDYYNRNPHQGYCQVVIAPKMARFKEQYVDALRR